MLKALSNSKLFFLALGITVALVGTRLSAAPSKEAQTDLERSVQKIAESLEKIQRDGIEVKVSQKWGAEEFKVKVVQ